MGRHIGAVVNNVTINLPATLTLSISSFFFSISFSPQLIRADGGWPPDLGSAHGFFPLGNFSWTQWLNAALVGSLVFSLIV